ncbi:MAG: hypothetical protein AB9Q22_10735 [Candidatus Reddybacter sp.]
MDPILTTGIVGAVGSVTGTILGTIVGYKLNNSKADVDVYLDNRVWLYYYESCFSTYVPITIVNEGAKSFTITSFEIELISPTNQKWKLIWEDFAEENSHKGEAWGRGKTAAPILVHGRSGIQHHLRFTNVDNTSDEFSEVKLPTGEYQLKINAFDRNTKCFKSKIGYFNISTEPEEALAKCRTEKQDLRTWNFPVRPNA